MKSKYNTHATRGFSVYEHNILLKYIIELNANNEYYDSFMGSDMEGKRVEFETDQDGYIVPSRIYNNSDYVCAFLGDSSVECSFVDQDKRYPYLVGRILEQQTGKRINSFNAAVSGADILSMLKVLLNKIYLEHPRIVFLCNTKSELLFLLSKTEDLFLGAGNNKKRIISGDSVRNEHLGIRMIEAVDILLRGRLKAHLRSMPQRDVERKEGSSGGVNERNVMELYQRDVEAFIQLCHCRNITPVLMTQANRYREKGRIEEFYIKHDFPVTHLSYEKFVAVYDACNELIRDAARTQEVMLIDLERMIEDPSAFLYDAVHYTDAGSVKIAHLIADELIQNRFL